MSVTDWCFLGGGNMAAAIIGGYLRATPEAKVTVIEPDRLKWPFFQELGCTCYEDISEINGVTSVVVAVKPQVFPAVVSSLTNALDDGALVVSIMVGLDTEVLGAALPGAAANSALRPLPQLQRLRGRS